MPRSSQDVQAFRLRFNTEVNDTAPLVELPRRVMIMRLCRFHHRAKTEIGFYGETHIVPLEAAAEAYRAATGDELQLPPPDDHLLTFLSPGAAAAAASRLAAWVADNGDALREVLVPAPVFGRIPKLSSASRTPRAGVASGAGVVRHGAAFPRPMCRSVVAVGPHVTVRESSPGPWA